MKIIEVHGDIVNYIRYADIEVFLHNANCFNTMGAGVAKALATNIHGTLEADRKTRKGDKTKLGTYSSFNALNRNGEQIRGYNIYGQYKYSNTVAHFDLDMFMKGFLSAINKHQRANIIMPKVGSLRGGCDWEDILRRITEDTKDHTGTLYIVNYVRNVDYLLIAGSRSYPDWKKVYERCDEHYNKNKLCLISGDAPNGADKFAIDWAKTKEDMLPLILPAQWVRFGDSAGMVRNAEMGNLCNNAELFFNGATPGTTQMQKILARKKIPYKIWKTLENENEQ